MKISGYEIYLIRNTVLLSEVTGNIDLRWCDVDPSPAYFIFFGQPNETIAKPTPYVDDVVIR